MEFSSCPRSDWQPGGGGAAGAGGARDLRGDRRQAPGREGARAARGVGRGGLSRLPPPLPPPQVGRGLTNGVTGWPDSAFPAGAVGGRSIWSMCERWSRSRSRWAAFSCRPSRRASSVRAMPCARMASYGASRKLVAASSRGTDRRCGGQAVRRCCRWAAGASHGLRSRAMNEDTPTGKVRP
jgi:hypothetical protein